MFEKMKNWYEDNKEAVLVGALCGAACLVGEVWGVRFGKRLVASHMAEACRMNQSFNVDVPQEGVRYLFKFGTEALNK